MTNKRCPKVPGDRLLVRIDKNAALEKYAYNEKTGQWEEKSSLGMVIKILKQDEVDRLQLANTDGYVVQIGPDAFLGLGSGEPRCKLGDKILLNKYSGVLLPDIGDDYTYRLISDEDVLLVWDGEGLND